MVDEAAMACWMLAVLASTFTCVAVLIRRDASTSAPPEVILLARLIVFAVKKRLPKELRFRFWFRLKVGATSRKSKAGVPKVLVDKSVLSTTSILLSA